MKPVLNINLCVISIFLCIDLTHTLLSCVGQAFIWMAGSSLIVKAHNHVMTKPMGSDLAHFNTHGVKVIWAGSSVFLKNM